MNGNQQNLDPGGSDKGIQRYEGQAVDSGVGTSLISNVQELEPVMESKLGEGRKRRGWKYGVGGIYWNGEVPLSPGIYLPTEFLRAVRISQYLCSWRCDGRLLLAHQKRVTWLRETRSPSARIHLRGFFMIEFLQRYCFWSSSTPRGSTMRFAHWAVHFERLPHEIVSNVKSHKITSIGRWERRACKG